MDSVTRILLLRQKLRLSQREMATEFGVTQGALAMWENGQRPIPEMALKLIEIYEEYLDEELAIKKNDDVIRELTNGWTKRLMSSFAYGAKSKDRQKINENLEKSLYSFLRNELSIHKVKRNIQVSAFNRLVTSASQSKGLPMKLVQVMTFLSPSMDREAREALEKIHELQNVMAPTVVAKIIHEDFGFSPSKLFAEWSPMPFASASIGQVHLAKLKTGERVAVKVQYPDIQKSVKGDLESLSFFTDLASIFSPESRSVINQIQAAILDETDYRREREFLHIFRNVFEFDKDIIIPKVYDDYCSRRVITMDYIDGKKINEFVSSGPEERNKAARCIAKFMTATTFKAGIMNTDTHAGNFIFCPGGKVGFIDFGRAIKVEAKGLDVLLKAVIKKDPHYKNVREVLPTMVKMKKGRELPFDKAWNFFLSQQAHLHSGDFKFTREYISNLMSEGKKNPLQKDVELSIEMAWSLATSMGLWNVFADLDTAVNFGEISLEVLERDHV